MKESRFAIVVLITLIVSVSITLVIGQSMAYGFYLTLILAVMGFGGYGYKYSDMFYESRKIVYECRTIFVIIILIGIIISVWLLSGAVPTIIYFLVGILSPRNLYVFAFIVTSILSLFIGSALGTISTFGIAILGISLSFGLDTNITLGAIVCGAFIADKLSPIAGLVNLNLKVADAKYTAYLKVTIARTVLFYFITCVFFTVLGYSNDASQSIEVVKLLKLNLAENFNISYALFLMPLMILVNGILGLDVKKNMTIVSVVGIVLAIMIQGSSIKEIIRSITLGYSYFGDSLLLKSMLKGGGAVPMMEVILIIIGALSLSRIFESTKTFEYVSEKISGDIRSVKDLYRKVGLSSIIMTSITCDQTLGILLPSKLFSSKLKEYNVKEEKLASIISDTGVIVAPLQFWNVNSIIIYAITGISVFSYIKYLIFIFLFVAFAFIKPE